MILAGIDEAGYGPLLGPLVVGCCAFEIDGGEALLDADEPPCLWKRLRRVAAKSRCKMGRKLHINDSKLVYSPAAGLKELEKSVLAISAASGEWCEKLENFLDRVAGGLVAELGEYAWYAPVDGETFPIEQDATSLRLLANAVRAEFDRTQTRCVHLAAQVIPERRLNRMLDATRNKSSVLFSIAAIHLDHLLRNFSDRDLLIYCDQQGGRERYGHLLRLMFEEWSLEVLAEGDGCSHYRLVRGGSAVQIIFREKAEAKCMSVALASMLSKYLREALMRRFNAWWQQLLPGLAPTAGYYSDGWRFLQDIETRRKELGIADAQLIRSR